MNDNSVFKKKNTITNISAVRINTTIMKVNTPKNNTHRYKKYQKNKYIIKFQQKPLLFQPNNQYLKKQKQKNI